MKKVTLKEVALRIRHRFLYLIVFSIICLLIFGVFLALEKMQIRDFIHTIVWIIAGFFSAIVLLPEDFQKEG